MRTNGANPNGANPNGANPNGANPIRANAGNHLLSGGPNPVNLAVKRLRRTTATMTGMAAVGAADGDSGTGVAAVIVPVAAATPAVSTRPNFGRTKSSNRWPEFLTFWTTTLSCAPPATSPGPTTSTSR